MTPGTVSPDDMLPSPRPPSLKTRLLEAGRSRLSGHALSQAARLGGNLVLARLLAPETFGIMAVAHLVLVSLTLLSEPGLREGIVQSRRGDDPRFLDTAWTVQALRGVLLGAAALLLAGLLHLAQATGLAGTWGDPLLPPAIAWVAAAAPIAGLQSVRVATAVRHFRHKQVIRIELAGQAAGIATALAWAWTAPSLGALVAGHLAAVLTSTAASHLLLPGPRHRPAWDRTALPELLPRGPGLLLPSILGTLAVGADRFFLAAVADARLLGLYAIGRLLAATLESGVTRHFAAASLSLLGAGVPRDPESLRTLYYRILAPFDFFLFFAAGFLFAAGRPLAALLYDPRYSQAGTVLALLALALPGLRFGMACRLYVALGHARPAGLAGAVRLGALAAFLPAGFWLGGFTGAVWALALHGYAVAPLVLHFNRRLGLADFRRELRALPCFPLGWGTGWLIFAPLGLTGGSP